MYLIEQYNVDLSMLTVCPQWTKWWTSYKGEVLKPNGKMTVQHRKFLPPDFLEGVMWLIPLAIMCWKTRGTTEYKNHLDKLPPKYRDSYHILIEYGVQYWVTMFLGMRGTEVGTDLKGHTIP